MLDERVWSSIYPADTFGAKQWSELLGADVGEEPPLPLGIHKILKSYCPFDSSKLGLGSNSKWGPKVEKTHMFVLIPKTINGKPLTLETLGELVQSKFPYIVKGIEPYYHLLNEAESDRSYWALITKDIIRESRKMCYFDQKKRVEKKGKQQYQVPRVIEVAVCIFTEFARSGTCLYIDRKKHPLGDDDKLLLTYTRCQETFKGRYDGRTNVRVLIGSFRLIGPGMDFDFGDKTRIGVAAIRKF